MPAAVVPIQLDLREFRAVPDGPDGYLELWRQIEPVIHQLDPHDRDTYRLDGPQGRLTLRFVDPASAPARLDAATRFAIRGVVEPPRILYVCAGCTAAGTTRYGPFVCSPCRTEKRPDRLCDDHAVIVDLNFGRVTCERHRPRCGCGGTGSFWCGGPVCHGRVAWCDRHRVAHPGDPARGYCADCYTRRFPACATPACGATGSMSCEYATTTGGSCGQRQCPRHGFRWQVYGPRRTGLALCPGHRTELGRLGRDQLIRQVVVGTSLRRRDSRGPRLPALPAIRHMLINVRREVVDIPALAGIVDGIRRGLAGTPHAEVFDEAYQKTVQTALRNAADDRATGLRHFARLQQYLRSAGRPALADQMTFSFFTSRSGILFVRVPEALRGQFYGTGRKHADAMGEFLGLKVQLEKS